MSVSLKVKIFDAKGTRILQVAKSTLTIGSASHCDVVLNDPSVGSEHTRAWIDGGRIWIQDLGSQNGTALNEIRLPALKPMLVRDLDVLRLGTSESTLGLEAIMVRAPVVKAAPEPAPPRPVAPSVKAAQEAKEAAAVRDPQLEKRKEEADRLGRELADLRLQLQMAKLEKTSNAELTQQLENLRNEIQKVHDQKEQWTEKLRQMEDEKVQVRKNVEVELENKAKAIQVLKTENEKDRETFEAERIKFDKEREKFELWKKDRITEVAKLNHGISVQKVKAWTQRPLSKEMVNEWESDLLHMLRKVLLGVNEPPPARAALPEIVVPPPQPAPVIQTVQAPVVAGPAAAAAAITAKQAVTTAKQDVITAKQALTSAKHAVVAPKQAVVGPPPSAMPARDDDEEDDESVFERKARKQREKRAARRRWRAIVVTSVVVVVIASLIAGISFFKGNHSTRTISSQSVEPPADARPPQPLVARGRVYQPKQGKKYRNSYTENVLFLENYVPSEENVDFRRRWTTELSKTASIEWKVDIRQLGPLLNEEKSLITDLDRLKATINPEREQEGIERMRARETRFLQTLDTILKNRTAVDKFLKFKRSFFMSNQGRPPKAG